MTTNILQLTTNTTSELVNVYGNHEFTNSPMGWTNNQHFFATRKSAVSCQLSAVSGLRNRGVATLPTVMVLGVMSLVVAVGITALSYTELFVSQGSAQSSRALFYAESGMRDALVRVARDKNFATTSYSIDFTGNGSGCAPAWGGCATVNVSATSPKTATSTGTMRSSVRTLTVEFPVNSDGDLSPGPLSALSPATTTTGAGTGPQGIVLSPNGASLYSANNGSNTVSQFSRNASTGLLTALSPASILAGSNPFDIAISPEGTSVYTTNWNDNSISQFIRDTNTGLLSGTATTSTLSQPKDIVVSPDGTSVYVTNAGANAITQYSRNTSTGLLTALTPASVVTGSSPYGIDISPDGTSVYATNSFATSLSQYSRASNGLLTPLSPATIVAGAFPDAVAVSPDGSSVYVANYNGKSISQYSRNPSTGLLTALSPASVPTCIICTSSMGVSGITISPDGSTVYAANNNNNTISQYSRDQSTGLLTPMSPFTVASVSGPYGLAVSPDGAFLYAANVNNDTVGQFRRSRGAVWTEVTN